MKPNMKKAIALTMLSAQAFGSGIIPTATSLVAHAEDSVPTTTITAGQDIAEELVNSKSGLTQVLTVNGRKLADKVTVNAGDNVTFDIIVTPGNQGLMTQFSDTLPDGLVFNPGSDRAISVYAVNNDGTVGDEITNEGKVVLNGNTVTWTPTDATQYFFAGKSGTKNRLLFHITTKAVSTVKAGSTLTNTAKMDLENPKDPENPPKPVEDKAEVEIPAHPEDPSIAKSVYKEASDGSIAIPTEVKNDIAKKRPTSVAYSFKTDNDGNKTVEIGDEKLFLEQVDVYIAEAEAYGEGTIDMAAIKAAAEVYKADKSAKNLAALAEAIKNVEAEVAKVSPMPGEATVKYDNIELADVAEKYVYVLDVKLPSRSVSKSLTIKDALEGVQAVEAANIKVYNSKGEDVTAKGEVKVETRKATKVVTWSASSEYIAELNADNTNKDLQMRISGVTVKDADKDELAKHKQGGVISIPNVANLIVDGYTSESNETLVRLPQDPENPGSTITKGVAAQTGKVDPKTAKANSKSSVNVPLNQDGSVKLPDGDEGGIISLTSNDDYATLKSNTEKAIARAKVFGMDTTELETLLAQLTEKSGNSDKAELVNAFKRMSTAYAIAKIKEQFAADPSKVEAGTKVAEEIEFEAGQSAIDATTDTYFKYLVNTSINPSKIGDYITISDPMDGVQSVSVDNVRLYDVTGADVTEQFAIKLEEKDGKKVLTAKASDEFVEKAKAAKANTKLQLVVYNVQAKVDKDTNIKNTAELDTGTEKLKSNETNVNIKFVKPAEPAEPAKPADPSTPSKPDIKTGANIAKNPLVIIGVLGALAAGVGAVFISRKKKHNA